MRVITMLSLWRECVLLLHAPLKTLHEQSTYVQAEKLVIARYS